MNIASAITFDTAEREYNEAWTAPSNTRFELPPVDVNTVLKKRYRVSPEQTLTRAMIWDMETKKAWDPLSYIPYVVSQARSWGRTTLRDGSTRFSRSSLQRGWIASDEGRVLEDVFVSDAKQTIYFLGRPQMAEESGNTLVASPFQSRNVRSAKSSHSALRKKVVIRSPFGRWKAALRFVPKADKVHRSKIRPIRSRRPQSGVARAVRKDPSLWQCSDSTKPQAYE